MPIEEVASYVGRCKKALERQQLALDYIRRSLAMQDGETPTGGDKRAAAGAGNVGRDDLLNRLKEAEQGLKQYENALRAGVDALTTRERPTA
jgi:hypothetical protein